MKRYALITGFQDGCPMWGEIELLSRCPADARMAAQALGLDFLEVAELVEIWGFPA